jgi:hypothetical protein
MIGTNSFEEERWVEDKVASKLVIAASIMVAIRPRSGSRRHHGLRWLDESDPMPTMVRTDHSSFARVR